MPTDDGLIDARGLKCPLPVLKLEKRLAAMAAGQSVTVLASDPMASIDVPLYCRQHGHDCTVTADPDATRFSVRKGA